MCAPPVLTEGTGRQVKGARLLAVWVNVSPNMVFHSAFLRKHGVWCPFRRAESPQVICVYHVAPNQSTCVAVAAICNVKVEVPAEPSAVSYRSLDASSIIGFR